MLHRHHHPVSLVDGVERSLRSGFDVVGSHLFADLRHAVGSDDATAHIDRLCEHDRHGEHLSGIGAQSVYHFLTNSVYDAAEFRPNLTEEVAESVGKFGRDGSLLRQSSESRSDVALQRSRGVSSCRRECSLLLVAE